MTQQYVFSNLPLEHQIALELGLLRHIPDHEKVSVCFVAATWVGRVGVGQIGNEVWIVFEPMQNIDSKTSIRLHEFMKEDGYWDQKQIYTVIRRVRKVHVNSLEPILVKLFRLMKFEEDSFVEREFDSIRLSRAVNNALDKVLK